MKTKIIIVIIAMLGYSSFVLAQDQTIKGNLVVNEGSLRVKSMGHYSKGLELTQSNEAGVDVSRISNYFKGSLSLGTWNTERFRIDENGKIVINDGYIMMKSMKSNSRGLDIKQSNENGIDVSRVFNYYRGPLLLGTWNKERVRINENGSVGIGTVTTGSHKLAVEGSIGAREIKVENGNWPDFVFEKKYSLPTLYEVETHIKEKGHLKDIPSAKEVESSGFYLGKMDAKLLQKIEELTLYTIAQEKKITSLEKQNLAIKRQKEQLKKQDKEIKELKFLVNKLLKNKN